MNNENQSKLENYIARIADVSTEAAHTILQAYQPCARELKLDKGQFLLHLGDIPDKIFYVKSGFLRKGYFRHDGSLKTYLFWPESAIFSEGIMLGKAPAQYIIEAMEDCELRYVSVNEVNSRIYKDALFMKSFIKFSEAELMDFLREGMIVNVPAAERYRNFLKKYPTLEGRISQGEIANYLGITPGSLSRLKKNI